jgi:transcriptional regulator with XRE-family HTH domain
MSQEEIFINGELLRLSREARGWVINDMATRACMSAKQIRQIEEGGMSAFYSAAVKATSAKKVGSLLGLSADQVFAQTVATVKIEDQIDSAVSIEQVEVESVKSVQVETVVAMQEQAADADADADAIEAEPHVVLPTPESTPNSKNSLWMIAVLLAVALALGAYFQPQEEPVVAEPAPPIQVLPMDAVDPASAADSAASSAEVAVVQASAPVAVAPQKTASSVFAIVAPVAAPAASTAVRSTSSAVANSPAASSAVKAP